VHVWPSVMLWSHRWTSEPVTEWYGYCILPVTLALVLMTQVDCRPSCTWHPCRCYWQHLDSLASQSRQLHYSDDLPRSTDECCCQSSSWHQQLSPGGRSVNQSLCWVGVHDGWPAQYMTLCGLTVCSQSQQHIVSRHPPRNWPMRLSLRPYPAGDDEACRLAESLSFVCLDAAARLRGWTSRGLQAAPVMTREPTNCHQLYHYYSLSLSVQTWCVPLWSSILRLSVCKYNSNTLRCWLIEQQLSTIYAVRDAM